MEIKQNLTRVNYTTSSSREIKYIVVHYTGNKGDTAKNNTEYFKTVQRGASAHYFVDSDSIWQCVEDRHIAWHCGAKVYRHPKCRNTNSIGVELCNGVQSFDTDTVQNAAWLIKELMQRYNVPVENVIRHYDVTGKLCPASLVDEEKWKEFKNLLREGVDMEELNNLKAEFKQYVEHTSGIINMMGKEIKALQDIINIMGKEIAELKSDKQK